MNDTQIDLPRALRCERYRAELIERFQGGFLLQDVAEFAADEIERLNAAPKVKPLVWEEYPVCDGPVMAQSVTPIGTYFVVNDTDDFSGLYCELITHKDALWFGSVNPQSHTICQHVHADVGDAEWLAMIDLIQADYERRILEAME